MTHTSNNSICIQAAEATDTPLGHTAARAYAARVARCFGDRNAAEAFESSARAYINAANADSPVSQQDIIHGAVLTALYTSKSADEQFEAERADREATKHAVTVLGEYVEKNADGKCTDFENSRFSKLSEVEFAALSHLLNTLSA